MGPTRQGRPHCAAGLNPQETMPLHATQDLGNDDLADHRDRVDQRVTESHARVGVGAAVREGEDCGLCLRATEQTGELRACLLYTSPSPRDYAASRMPSSA